jgi:hypothetical protein
MKDSRVFGVNARCDGRWLAWTVLCTEPGIAAAGTFRELSVHDSEAQAHEAANQARERHLAGLPTPNNH